MKFALTLNGEGLVKIISAESLYHAAVSVRGLDDLKAGQYVLTNSESPENKVRIFVSRDNAVPMILLNTPEKVRVEDDKTITCLQFRQFCNVMQYPEPTLVEVCHETEILLTLLINDGLVSCWEAYKACASGYSFNEDGREVVRMKEPMVLILSLAVPAAEAAQRYLEVKKA